MRAIAFLAFFVMGMAMLLGMSLSNSEILKPYSGPKLAEQVDAQANLVAQQQQMELARQSATDLEAIRHQEQVNRLAELRVAQEAESAAQFQSSMGAAASVVIGIFALAVSGVGAYAAIMWVHVRQTAQSQMRTEYQHAAQAAQAAHQLQIRERDEANLRAHLLAQAELLRQQRMLQISSLLAHPANAQATQVLAEQLAGVAHRRASRLRAPALVPVQD